jgi:hypothetical protein
MHRWLRWLFLGLTVLVLAYVGGCMFHLFDPRGRWTTSWCVRDLISDVKSPDGKHSAQAVEFSCTFGSQNFTAVAIVKPGRSPSNDDEVLMAEIPHGGLKLDWKGPDHLEISVSWGSIVAESKPQHAGVQIDLVKGFVP